MHEQEVPFGKFKKQRKGSLSVPAASDVSSSKFTAGRDKNQPGEPRVQRALHGFAQQTPNAAEGKPTKLTVNPAQGRLRGGTRTPER